jgi:hypothetical protein
MDLTLVDIDLVLCVIYLHTCEHRKYPDKSVLIVKKINTKWCNALFNLKSMDYAGWPVNLIVKNIM